MQPQDEIKPIYFKLFLLIAFLCVYVPMHCYWRKELREPRAKNVAASAQLQEETERFRRSKIVADTMAKLNKEGRYNECIAYFYWMGTNDWELNPDGLLIPPKYTNGTTNRLK